MQSSINSVIRATSKILLIDLEFERELYTTLYENMVSLHAIWVSCWRPNLEIRADDARKKDALTMAASALHMTVSCVGRSFTLESLYKRMHDMHGMRMRHAIGQPCKFAVTMRTVRFGTVRGTTSDGYNMQKSTSWTLTSIHGCIGGGCMCCGYDPCRGFRRSNTSSLQRRWQHVRLRKVRDHVKIISLTRLHSKLRRRRR